MLSQIIRGPLDYLLSQPGKKLRAKLIHSFNEWFQIPDDKLQVVIDVVELLHTASLLSVVTQSYRYRLVLSCLTNFRIDDIQDGSKLRRGRPSAHMVYGSAQTINSANFAYFLAQEKLGELKSLQAFNVFTTELLNLHRGQGMELYFRDNLICPTEAQYMEMVSNKTGGLFRLAVGLMQSQSDFPMCDFSSSPRSPNNFQAMQHQQANTRETKQRLHATHEQVRHHLSNPRRLPEPAE